MVGEVGICGVTCRQPLNFGVQRTNRMSAS